MIIRAYSVFEHIVYHCALIDGANPGRPVLEVDALVRPGDVDGGPLLVPLADYVFMVGGPERAAPHVRSFEERGRIVDHLGVAHLSFPFWTPIELFTPKASRPPDPPAPG